jgi:integrase
VAGCYRNDRPDAPEYAHIPKYREKKRERFLSQGELQRLGQVLAEVEAEGSETPFIVAAFRLLILTGCRLGEIQTLKWDYIKYGAHQVSIGRADFDPRSSRDPQPFQPLRLPKPAQRSEQQRQVGTLYFCDRWQDAGAASDHL